MKDSALMIPFCLAEVEGTAIQMGLWCSDGRETNQFEKGSNPHSTTSSITSDIYGPEYHDIRNCCMETYLPEFDYLIMVHRKSTRSQAHSDKGAKALAWDTGAVLSRLSRVRVATEVARAVRTGSATRITRLPLRRSDHVQCDIC